MAKTFRPGVSTRSRSVATMQAQVVTDSSYSIGIKRPPRPNNAGGNNNVPVAATIRVPLSYLLAASATLLAILFINTALLSISTLENRSLLSMDGHFKYDLHHTLQVSTRRARNYQVRRARAQLHPSSFHNKQMEKSDNTSPLQHAIKDRTSTSSIGMPHAFTFDAVQAETVLHTPDGAHILRRPITAYLEGPLHDTIPGTGSRGNVPVESDKGTPPDFVIPLPLRTQAPDQLRRLVYPQFQTCHDLPAALPVDRGLEYNGEGRPIVWNVGNDPTPDDFAEQEAPYCPVELDPFLPWIHDIVPAVDGSRIQFVAQNKRRCRTGSQYTKDVNRLVPQVALMQAVSVQRINATRAQQLARQLWNNSNEYPDDDAAARYRLAPLNESDVDGQETRFICRFTTIDFDTLQTIVIGETLSTFPFNYEFVNHRKGHGTATMLTPKGKDTTSFWMSTLRFDCPVPDIGHWRALIAAGTTVLRDGTPTLRVDVVPIRTSVRYHDEVHLNHAHVGPMVSDTITQFDAATRWGPRQVLPRVEASGRWTNLPICAPPVPAVRGAEEKTAVLDSARKRNVELQKKAAVFGMTSSAGAMKINKTGAPSKPHTLSACLWASTSFRTRGGARGTNTDGHDRLLEWIEFHLMVGFDHIYVYDNSGATTNETNLAPITALFPGRVTRIDWPSIVCNNNIPAHDSTGERSSQYAAENSCRLRYGPYTEWMASFDTDEYMVPAGNYTNFRDVLRDASVAGTQILSFRSSRGKLRPHASHFVGPEKLEKSSNYTFLEAYNCDSASLPKDKWADRARKQMYRTDYVLLRFVHYSTVTHGYLQTYADAQAAHETWSQHYGDRPPIERYTDEVSQAIMVHTKSVSGDLTRGWPARCRHDFGRKFLGCFVAVPFANTQEQDALARRLERHDIAELGNASTFDPATGLEYNCYVNDRIDRYWLPRLKTAIFQRTGRLFL